MDWSPVTQRSALWRSEVEDLSFETTFLRIGKQFLKKKSNLQKMQKIS